MDKRVKDLWVTELRSGNYVQTTGCLNDGVGFCCLGVLTDLYCKEKNEQWIEVREEDSGTRGRKFGIRTVDDPYRTEISTLPRSVEDWAGLEYSDPDVIVGFLENEDDGHNEPDRQNLSTVNDDGATFASIALLIEDQL
jgi:hypothetical protein